MRTKKTLSIIVLTIAMLLSLFTACSPRITEISPPSSEPSNAPPLSLSQEPTVGSIIPDLLYEVAEKYELNDHTVGWLNVPSTPIDDVVLFHDTDNFFYFRRNFEREQMGRHYEGVYYADFRSVFGDGSFEELGVNTCIYGHSLTDVPEHQNFSIRSAPLHNFRDEDFARENPYFFFSTKSDNFAVEVFAVFVANSDNAALPYNRNIVDDETHEDFINMVREEILPRSKWIYECVEIRDDDKFVVLSTCIYNLDTGPEFSRDGRSTNYPNTYMRYAIMGRIARPDELLKLEANVTFNGDVIIDPDGRWNN